MIPRGSPYISWTDLFVAALHCLTPGNAAAARRDVEASWGGVAGESDNDLHTVAVLSVRSGLDALLQEWDFPTGGEIIVSAITIPHILDILAHHRLVAVPVDIDTSTLAVDADTVRRAITRQTKAILVAHLFGSRMPMDGIAAVARQHQVPLIEDCAQAYDGSSYRGHSASAVSMFSFGSIKRQTALGGGLLAFQDGALAERVRVRLCAYPRQTRRAYARRVFTMVGIKSLCARAMFRAFLGVCRLCGWDHDLALGTALRSFSGGDLMTRLRQQPSAPLLRVLRRRIRQSAAKSVAERVAIVQAVIGEFPGLARPGAAAEYHRHWLFPMLAPEPDRMMRELWTRGYDATCGASNLTCVPTPTGRIEPLQATRLMATVVYLPLYPAASASEMHEMARVIRDLGDSAPRVEAAVGGLSTIGS